MNVDLTPELAALVEGKVQSGLYANASEVVREALRLLGQQDRLREAHLSAIGEGLAEGIAQADRGELLDGPEVMSEFREFLKRKRDAS